MTEPSELRGHVLKIELGEFTGYHLTCNLDDAASCHQVCETHMDGGCAETHLDLDIDQAPCVSAVYRGGCVIAEWVNDGGIESVDFDHTIELPVEYQWNASHEYPTLIPSVPEPPNDAKTLNEMMAEVVAFEHSKGWQ